MPATSRGRFLLLFAVLLAAPYPCRAADGSLSRVRERGCLLWGGDAEGGAPYVFPDPGNPDRLVGFEVDLADAVAREIGVRARFSQNAWDSLLPALQRGDFDVALNGIEITPERSAKALFSRPYYVYTEQLVVRKGEASIRGLSDLAGKRVGTLSGACSECHPNVRSGK